MSTFEVGDTVRVVESSNFFAGRVGTVEKSSPLYRQYHILVRFSGPIGGYHFGESELVLLSPAELLALVPCASEK